MLPLPSPLELLLLLLQSRSVTQYFAKFSLDKNTRVELSQCDESVNDAFAKLEER
jgi:hypothetical protein